MKQWGVSPDEHSYNGVIDACARAGEAQNAEAWLGRMLEEGLRPNVISYSVESADLLCDMRRCDGSRMRSATAWSADLFGDTRRLRREPNEKWAEERAKSDCAAARELLRQKVTALEEELRAAGGR